jgi:hypothetical protein
MRLEQQLETYLDSLHCEVLVSFCLLDLFGMDVVETVGRFECRELLQNSRSTCGSEAF